MKTKFILHGGIVRDNNELNRTFFKEITSGLQPGATVLFVGLARDEENRDEIFKRDTAFIQKNSEIKNLRFINATIENFIEEIKASNAIFITGGDTLVLLDTVQSFGKTFIDALNEKIVAGSSAGAYIFSNYFYSNLRGKVFKGLGILTIRIICHYLNEEFNASAEKVKLLEKYPNSLELIVLKDYEWVVREIDL